MTDRSEIKAVGGSNIAAITGQPGYESAYSLYLRLTGKLPPLEDTPEMRWGRELESRVAAMFADEHEEYEVVETGRWHHPEHDFLIASPDRILIQDGEPKAVLEIKTSDIGMRHLFGEEMTDQIPIQYLCQVIWYMGMLNLPLCHVAVYFRKHGRKAFADYAEYKVDACPSAFESMVLAAVKFWEEHIVADVPPEITATDAHVTQYLRSRYPRHSDGKWLTATDEVNELAVRLLAAKEDLDTAEKEFELCKLLMIDKLGDCEGVTTKAGKITYKASNPSRKTDWKAIVDSFGIPQEIINRYTNEVPGSRRFLLPR